MVGRKYLAALLGVLLVAASAPQQRPAPAPVAPPPQPVAETVTPPETPATTPQLTAADLSAWMDGYMPGALQAGKIAGAQVSVVKDGAVLFTKGYGYADVAAKTPMDPYRHLMRIGSTSKLLTWTAVMQQVERGKIDLNADVNRYLDFRIAPPSGRPVTMIDLMNHRAGFEEGLRDLLASDPKLLKTTEQYLKENPRPFLFQPGAAPAYSNYGVSLAGYIVQRVSGEPFDDYVERHILAPLRMARTTFRQPLPGALAPLAAKGYRQSDGPPSPFELVTTAPAGSVSTPASDMANFMLAYLGGGRLGTAQILRPETVRLMSTPSYAAPSGFATLAHGFFRSTQNGLPVLGHGGDTVVFHTDLNLLPSRGVGFFVSFSSRGENQSVYGVRERLFNLFMDRYYPAPPVQTPPAIANAADHAAALAGHYETTRRVESGFISLFYLLQQEQVVANADGTISLGSVEDTTFREVASDMWQQVGGTRRLQVGELNGRRSILDSANPVGVLQTVPFWRNATVFQLVVGLSLLVLLLTVLVWPVAALVRRRYSLPPLAVGRLALARRLTRIAALGDLIYFAGWYTVLSPILDTQVDVYNKTLDGTIRVLQVAAVVPIAAAAIGIWNVVLSFRQPLGWGPRLRAVLVATALLGFLWMAWAGNLIGWTLNY